MADLARSSGFAVGFDLDMTLADTRRSIGAAFTALAARTGVFVDVATVVSRLGPPLEQELAYWFPKERIPEAALLYKRIYREIAIPLSVAMPGAADAVEAVRARGGRVVVVTAKSQPNAERTVEALGLPVDDVIGDLFAAGKGTALRAHGVGVYVGDHTGDVDAARAAAAHSVGVATGPFDAAALRAYGADVVLDSLAAFPAWLAGHGRAA